MVADRAANPRTHRRKICLFLGAGADISAGGITFAQLKRRALEEFARRPVSSLTSSEVLDRDFDQLFLELRDDERSLLVETAFGRMRQAEPSEAYKLTVLLAEAGGLGAVVTTNFDVMLERAEQQLQRDIFQVFAPGVARPDLRSYGRYELPKIPYIKLHGDLTSRAVSVLTSTDIDDPKYDQATVDLLSDILSSHDLIVAGYSGYDTALARIIGNALSGSEARIYWCNPSAPDAESPLAMAMDGKFSHIPLPFDALMAEIARPVLERPSLTTVEPTYVGCLLDWRINYCNREYGGVYGERDGQSVASSFARRRHLEERLTQFLSPNKPLALVTGPSGCGKTTLGLRLKRAWSAHDTTQLMLLRARTFPESADVEQHVMQLLGGLGFQSGYSLFPVEHWLRTRGQQLVLFVDAINEFSPDIDRCIALLRSLLRFCYFLPEGDSAIRVIATVRQESWNAMLPHLDMAQLHKSAWSPIGSQHALNTLACNKFSYEELQEAVDRLRLPGLTARDLDALPPSTVEQMCDPYLLRTIADSARSGGPVLPTATLYQRMFEGRLRGGNTAVSPATVPHALSVVAMGCLTGKRQRFRETDIEPATLRAEILRLAQDLDIVQGIESGFLQFSHDRTFEYFLALGLANGLGPPLETLHDLREYLRAFGNDGRAVAAARLYYELHPTIGVPVLAEVLGAEVDFTAPADRHDYERLFGFVHELIVQFAEQNLPLVRTLIDDAIDAGQRGSLGASQLGAIVHAAASLPAEVGVPLLARVEHPATPLPATEAAIFAIDRLVRRLLSDSERKVDMLKDKPFSDYFSEPSLSKRQRVGRLISLAMQLGPDNTHPDEYRLISQSLTDGLQTLTEGPSDPLDASEFGAYFLANCDRLMFNSSPEGIARFFENQARADLGEILEDLESGGVLTEAHYARVAKYSQSLEYDIEYHLCAMLFVASSLNDIDATLALAEKIFWSLGPSANPVQIDFLHEVIVYVHVLHALEYDEDRFGRWEEIILRDRFEILLYQPGLERGERRGFSDPFDQVFEDGFGVIYPYGILRPSIARRKSRYVDYVRSDFSSADGALPLYRRWLETYLGAGRIAEALQLLQSLAGVIVPWPREGLSAMLPAIGDADKNVHRAVLRILAEAYNRHPAETMKFLRTAGLAVSDDDLLEIKVRRDARLGRRQVSEEEWARILHLLLQFDGARAKLFGILYDVVRSTTLQEAVEKAFRRLRWDS